MTARARSPLAAGAALLMVPVLLLATAFAAAVSRLPVERVGEAAERAPGEPEPRAVPEPPQRLREALDAGVTVPRWPLLVAAVAAFLLVAAALVYLVRRRWQRRRGVRWRQLRPAGRAAEGDGSDLVAAVDSGLGELSGGGDPRSAVIICWTRLEAAADAAGVARHRSDTATDLVLRLLRTHQVSEPALHGLADVYRQARYAPHTVDDQMHTRARSALRRLRGELASGDGTSEADNATRGAATRLVPGGSTEGGGPP